MFKKAIAPSDTIEVSERTIRRARQVPAGTEAMWIDGTLGQIGSAVTHHRYGDPLLDEAITGAEALLALLHEIEATRMTSILDADLQKRWTSSTRSHRRNRTRMN
jgi:hypothetical protein